MGEYGEYWLLYTPELEGELLSLDGQAVRVHGMLRRSGSDSREISVEWYELIAPPGGFAAVGTLGLYRDELVLRCSRGRVETASIEVLVEGPLRESIEHYVGFRVWIGGERAMVGDGAEYEKAGTAGGLENPSSGAPERFHVIVSEFGVLGPAIPDLDVPHSTLPDSSR